MRRLKHITNMTRYYSVIQLVLLTRSSQMKIECFDFIDDNQVILLITEDLCISPR